jgi:acyl-coenzyme A thioesterase PaaI-like protein
VIGTDGGRDVTDAEGQGPSGTTAPDEAATIAGLRQLGEQLPFNRHMGVEVRELRPGYAVTVLPGDERLTNHLGGVHAIAELAPVELAGALAASSRFAALVARGFVPVVGGLRTRYRAPAHGTLVATAEVPVDAVAVVEAAADAGDRPRMTVEVVVADEAGTVVTTAELDLVYLDVGREPPR